ncbi:MAG: hypothetical protein ABWZ25_16310 [Chitinophagaceae bacterium]
MRLSIFLIVLLFTVNAGNSQQINGYWKGRLVMEPGGCFPVYNIEFQIRVTGNRITGTSYHYSDTTNYVKEDFEGIYDSTSNALIIEEKKVSVFRIPADCIPCIKKYSLTYHTDGREEQIRGSWTGKTMDNRSICPAGTIVLTRIQKSAFDPPVPSVILNRKNILIREIFVDTGIVQLDFYDNGEIDGDTISVFVNNIPIATGKLIGAKPVTAFVRIDLSRPTYELVMVADNLGSIPPNTALMIVYTGGKRYLLNVAADGNKNALVRFIYQRP